MPIELAAAFDGAIKRFSPLEEETPAAAVQIQFRANFVSANPEHPAPRSRSPLRDLCIARFSFLPESRAE